MYVYAPHEVGDQTKHESKLYVCARVYIHSIQYR